VASSRNPAPLAFAAAFALLAAHCDHEVPEGGFGPPTIIDVTNDNPLARNGYPDVEFDPGTGVATVLWHRSAEIHFAGAEIGNWSSRYIPGSGWQPPTRLPAILDAPQPATLSVLGDGGLVAVWQGVLSGQVFASAATPQGAWGEALLLAPYPENDFVLGPDGRGHAAIFWVSLDPGAIFPLPPDRLLSRRYERGLGWTPETLVATMSMYAATPMVSAAFAGSGEGIVVWDEYDASTPDRYDLAFSLFAPQVGWSPRRLVGPEAHYTRDGRNGLGGLAVENSGDTLLVWSRSDGVFAQRHRQTTGWEPGATRLSSVQGLSPLVAADLRGNAVVAWLQDEPNEQGRRLYVSRYEPDTGWGRPVQPHSSGPYTLQAALAVAPQGRAFVAWKDAATPQGEGPSTAWAWRFEPASGWDTPTRLQDGGTEVDVACDAQGRAIAAWSAGGRVWVSRFE
jgi:hypothetical protein